MYLPDLPIDGETAITDRRYGLRLWIAALLRASGQALQHLAARLSFTEPVTQEPEPWTEFYADAGAPEGALYVNGKLVGHIEGVTRL